ncbi:MAG: hypothetical protein ACRDHE_00400 [Ktedonobacterales bacterium]
MHSLTADRYWECFRTLPKEIRKQAYEAYGQFALDSFFPGLAFKEVNKLRHLWSVRVTRGYRAVGVREGDSITWVWIGTHREYEKFIAGR